MRTTLQQAALLPRLAQLLMARLPAPALEQLSTLILRAMQRRHPRLFEGLARLPRSVVSIEPTDLPHRFTLGLGRSPFTLTVSRQATTRADATVKGSLRSLLDMLDGRIDGDTLFFDRAITLTGDASVVMALRNTMDREDLDLERELRSLLGPLEAPAGRAARKLEHAVTRLRGVLPARLFEARTHR
jgi:predicted lipid carrier protein YhbT